MENSYEVVTMRPGGIVNVLKSGLSKKEADALRDEWGAFYTDLYHKEHCPKVVSRKENNSRESDN
jgi:hypothetical protein